MTYEKEEEAPEDSIQGPNTLLLLFLFYRTTLTKPFPHTHSAIENYPSLSEFQLEGFLSPIFFTFHQLSHKEEQKWEPRDTSKTGSSLFSIAFSSSLAFTF
jgi:hypothetical protein